MKVLLESKYEAESGGGLPRVINAGGSQSVRQARTDEVVVVCGSLLYGLPQQRSPQFACGHVNRCRRRTCCMDMDMNILSVSWLSIVVVDETIRLNVLHLCAGSILCCLSSIFVNGSCAKL
jgi:hypothetical protein